MAKKRSGGGMPAGGPIKQIIWWLVIAMILLAAWRGIGAKDANGVFEYFKGLAGQTEETFTDVGDTVKKQIPGSDVSPAPEGSASPSAEPAESSEQPSE